jgi:type I restriction enzyme S subunit
MKNVWKEKSIGEILRLEYGKPLDESDRKPNGRFPVYGANGEKARTDKFYHDKPSIIVGRKGSAGEINLTQKKFWPLDVTYFVTFDEQQHDLRFLYYLLTTLELTTLAKGVKPGINRNEVYSQVTKVPALPEQQRIVGILDEAFKGIATAKVNAERNLQNARALFESHLQSVFTQRGERWTEKTLEDICVKITDGEHLRPQVTSSGVPFLSAKDVLADDVVFTDPLFVSERDAVRFRRRCNPETGDILIVSRGATVGRTCVVKTNRMFCLLGSVILLKVGKTQSSQFVSYALKSPAIRSQLITASEAAAQQAIYLRDIKPLKIGCPSLTEQRVIVSQLDALNTETQRLASLYERKLAALEALKKSLLHQAFTGEL